MAKETFDKARLRIFIRNVKQEILNMQAGESRFRAGAVHFEKDQGPALNGLKLLEDHPSKKAFDNFIFLAKQDFGATAGEAFEGWAQGVFPVDSKAGEKAAERSFEIKVKDVFYDCFKAANIPLSPKQVDRLERQSLKLAATFKAEISTEVGSQLNVLVKKLRDKEDKQVPVPHIRSDNVDDS